MKLKLNNIYLGMLKNKLLTTLYVFGGFLLIIELTVIDDFDRLYQYINLTLMIFILSFIIIMEIRNKWFK